MTWRALQELLLLTLLALAALLIHAAYSWLWLLVMLWLLSLGH